MTGASFYKLALSLWGEDWRPELGELLARSGQPYSRQSLWNWQTGKCPVPEHVAEILQAEAKRKRRV